MISFQNVSLHFGDRRLFDDISFMVNPKDRIGLVGKNGAGKSTLMKTAVGQANIDKGTASAYSVYRHTERNGRGNECF